MEDRVRTVILPQFAEMPNTAPVLVVLLLKPLRILPEQLIPVPLLLEPNDIPVIAVGAEDPVALIFEIVLPETTELLPALLMNIHTTAKEPQVQLLKILLLIFLTGPSDEVLPSILFQPFMAVAPVRVILEKLFPVWFIVFPVNDGVVAVYIVTTPPDTGLENDPTMLLLLQLSVAPAREAMVPVRLIKVTLPAVLATRLVNVLLLILSVVAPATA